MTSNAETRRLTVDDFDRVVSIDSKLSGQWRQRFYKKRLAAALAGPRDFISVGVEKNGALVGFAFAHLLRGDYGSDDTVAVLDAVGVDPRFGRAGVGHDLLNGMYAEMRRKHIRELHTQVDWRNVPLLSFLASNGFETAPRLVLERETAEQTSSSRPRDTT